MTSVIFGLLGLGLIVFFHELGHFIAARLCGVTVEAFSIGMGPVLLHKQLGTTDFRLSLIPFGGYCAMKGEKDFQRALDEKLSEIPRQDDSFYGVPPLKRLIIAFSGPLANFIFAIIAFSVIAMTTYTYQTAGNRVILLTDLYPQEQSAAALAGVKTGDRIVSVNGEKIDTFNKIVETVSVRPQETVVLGIDRDGRALEISVPVDMNMSTGAGRIGVISWIDPVIQAVEPSSPAAAAALEVGDRITAVAGIPVQNTAELQALLAGRSIADLTVEKASGGTATVTITPGKSPEGSPLLGIQFMALTITSSPLSFFPALAQGVRETAAMFMLTVKSIGSLFKGVDFTSAVSGPIRITVMLGDVAKSGFSAGFSEGLVTVLSFLALLNVSLFLMNLLPIPVLDGGLILFALVEVVRRKPVSPRVLYAVQMAGLACVLLIAALAVFSDFRYLFTFGK